MKMNKKGVGLADLLKYGILFVAVAIVLSVGGQILGQIRTSSTTLYDNTTAWNVTGYGMNSLNTLGTWLPIIAIVVAAIVIIGILIYNFKFGSR